ncbi:hypothetical protein VTK56DRAFT_4675 [Thermocarpiscus australiensis]
MWHTVVNTVICILHPLSNRVKRAKHRTPLDDDSSSEYSLKREEKPPAEIAAFINSDRRATEKREDTGRLEATASHTPRDQVQNSGGRRKADRLQHPLNGKEAHCATCTCRVSDRSQEMMPGITPSGLTPPDGPAREATRPTGPRGAHTPHPGPLTSNPPDLTALPPIPPDVVPGPAPAPGSDQTGPSRDLPSTHHPSTSSRPAPIRQQPLPALPVPSPQQPGPGPGPGPRPWSKPRSSPLLPLPPPRLATTPLPPATLKQLLDAFDAALSHTRYAVCGRAALAVWGWGCREKNWRMPMPMPPHVSVVCPAADRDVILAWARTAGWYTYPSSYPDPYPYPGCGGGGGGHEDGCVIRVGVSSASSLAAAAAGESEHGGGGGEKREEQEEEIEVRAFRLRTVDDEEVWEALERVRPLGLEPPYAGWVGEMIRTEAQVLAVPTLLDQFARAWCAWRGGGGGDGGGKEKVREVGEMILWLLRRLARDVEECGSGARWQLTPRNVPRVVDGRFWMPFVRGHPEAFELLARCGLSGPVVAAWSGPATTTLEEHHDGGTKNPLDDILSAGSRYLPMLTTADDEDERPAVSAPTESRTGRDGEGISMTTVSNGHEGDEQVNKHRGIPETRGDLPRDEVHNDVLADFLQESYRIPQTPDKELLSLATHNYTPISRRGSLSSSSSSSSTSSSMASPGDSDPDSDSHPHTSRSHPRPHWRADAFHELNMDVFDLV